MSNLTEGVEKILNEPFSVKDYSFIPTHSNKELDELNVGKKFSAAVIYIDMRGSTTILKNHNKSTVAKLHKAYYEIIIPIVMRMKGRIRSYNGDSLLAFFHGTPKNAVNDAIKTAFQINFAFTDEKKGLNKVLDKYTTIDFGIGVDYGEILCTKIGYKSSKYEYSSDLIWIGHPVNTSVKIGDVAKIPKSISISEKGFKLLSEHWKYFPKRNFLGIKYKGDLWENSHYNYGGEKMKCYISSHRYPVY